MKYTIDWSEKKTVSTGKEKMNATLNDGTNITENVTIWADFPGFAELMTGHSVEGDLVPAKDPKYGPTLYPPKPAPTATSGFKGGNMNKMMEKKAEAIENAQENKSLGIKLSSTIRMAVDLTIAQMGRDDVLQADEATIKGMIKGWRAWLLEEFDKPNLDRQPF